MRPERLYLLDIVEAADAIADHVREAPQARLRGYTYECTLSP